MNIFDMEIIIFRKIKDNRKIDLEVSIKELEDLGFLSSYKTPFLALIDNRNKGYVKVCNKTNTANTTNTNELLNILDQVTSKNLNTALYLFSSYPFFEDYFNMSKLSIINLSSLNLNYINSIIDSNDNVSHNWFIYDDESLKFLMEIEEQEDMQIDSSIKISSAFSNTNNLYIQDKLPYLILSTKEYKSFLISFEYSKDINLTLASTLLTTMYEIFDKINRKLEMMNAKLKFHYEAKILKVQGKYDYIHELYTPLGQIVHIHECIKANTITELRIVDNPFYNIVNSNIGNTSSNTYKTSNSVLLTGNKRNSDINFMSKNNSLNFNSNNNSFSSNNININSRIKTQTRRDTETINILNTRKEIMKKNSLVFMNPNDLLMFSDSKISSITSSNNYNTSTINITSTKKEMKINISNDNSDSASSTGISNMTSIANTKKNTNTNNTNILSQMNNIASYSTKNKNKTQIIQITVEKTNTDKSTSKDKNESSKFSSIVDKINNNTTNTNTTIDTKKEQQPKIAPKESNTTNTNTNKTSNTSTYIKQLESYQKNLQDLMNKIEDNLFNKNSNNNTNKIIKDGTINSNTTNTTINTTNNTNINYINEKKNNSLKNNTNDTTDTTVSNDNNSSSNTSSTSVKDHLKSIENNLKDNVNPDVTIKGRVRGKVVRNNNSNKKNRKTNSSNSSKEKDINKVISTNTSISGTITSKSTNTSTISIKPSICKETKQTNTLINIPNTTTTNTPSIQDQEDYMSHIDNYRKSRKRLETVEKKPEKLINNNSNTNDTKNTNINKNTSKITNYIIHDFLYSPILLNLNNQHLIKRPFSLMLNTIILNNELFRNYFCKSNNSNNSILNNLTVNSTYLFSLTAQLYIGKHELSNLRHINYNAIISDLGLFINCGYNLDLFFNMRIIFKEIVYSQLNLASSIIIKLYIHHSTVNSSKDLLCWINFKLFDHKNQLKTGYNKINARNSAFGDYSYFNFSNNNTHDFSNKMHLLYLKLEDFASPVEINSDYINPNNTNTNNPNNPNPNEISASSIYSRSIYSKASVYTKNINHINESDYKVIQKIKQYNPFTVLNTKDKEVLWKNKYAIGNIIIELIPRLLQCIDYRQVEQLIEIDNLLKNYSKHLDPISAIELLTGDYLISSIRKYAVSCFQLADYSKTNDYLIQLVQALKYEINHNSYLAKYLLKIAIKYPTTIGHSLFWKLKSEMHNKSIQQRFGLYIEAFLSKIGKVLFQNFQDEVWLVNRLLDIADIPDKYGKFAKDKNLKNNKDLMNKEYKEALDKLNKEFNGRSISLPINFKLRVNGIYSNKCKVMNSKKKPLWIAFKNSDSCYSNTSNTTNTNTSHNTILIMFKKGDDLRQDILTLQLFKIMQTLWFENKINLKMQLYSVISTGNLQGMLEIVTESVTLAMIHKEYGGATSAFSNKPLKTWLDKNSKSEIYTNNFKLSCAAYCIATYVLGIGDRHNDNIMVKSNGELFHIDFGHFLGHFKYKYGIKRERAPFVFTKEFKKVLGGSKSNTHVDFKQICYCIYEILRKNSGVFVNLLRMMLCTDIPELTEESISKFFCIYFIY